MSLVFLKPPWYLSLNFAVISMSYGNVSGKLVQSIEKDRRSIA